jgi:four helix bundle protein
MVRRYQDLATWKLAEAMKDAVFTLVRGSPSAMRNFTWRDQIFDSAGAPSKHIAEGFLRCSPHELCHFLDYAISSIGETENHLRDGVALGYYPAALARPALRLAFRCSRASLNLKRSQKRYIEEHGDQWRRRPRRSAKRKRA